MAIRCGAVRSAYFRWSVIVEVNVKTEALTAGVGFFGVSSRFGCSCSRRVCVHTPQYICRYVMVFNADRFGLVAAALHETHFFLKAALVKKLTGKYGTKKRVINSLVWYKT